MDNNVVKEWKKSKKELAFNIEEMITNGSELSETLKVMLNMVENSKIKTVE